MAKIHSPTVISKRWGGNDCGRYERDELHRAIRAISDELWNSLEGWGFMNYVLGTMLYRYKLGNYINRGRDCGPERSVADGD